MNMQLKTEINASRESIWKVNTDIENADRTVSGITKVEIMERPESGLIGLKWKETRMLFGKEATEVMWITEAKENEYYLTRAENHGTIYLKKLALENHGNITRFTIDFKANTQGMMATFMANFMGPLVKNTMVRLIRKDLEDIKNKAEKN